MPDEDGQYIELFPQLAVHMCRKAQEFSARLELERQRQRAARRTEADL